MKCTVDVKEGMSYSTKNTRSTKTESGFEFVATAEACAGLTAKLAASTNTAKKEDDDNDDSEEGADDANKATEKKLPSVDANLEANLKACAKVQAKYGSKTSNSWYSDQKSAFKKETKSSQVYNVMPGQSVHVMQLKARCGRVVFTGVR